MEDKGQNEGPNRVPGASERPHGQKLVGKDRKLLEERTPRGRKPHVKGKGPAPRTGIQMTSTGA